MSVLADPEELRRLYRDRHTVKAVRGDCVSNYQTCAGLPECWAGSRHTEETKLYILTPAGVFSFPSYIIVFLSEVQKYLAKTELIASQASPMH